MKIQEFQIGDLVIKDYFDIGKTFDKVDFEDFRPQAAECDYIQPIPLTLELLKINGYEEFGEMYRGIIQYRLYLDDCKVKIEHVICMPKWDLSIGANIICDIYYVHQLQHALRLCGLNDLADNFKLE